MICPRVTLLDLNVEVTHILMPSHREDMLPVSGLVVFSQTCNLITQLENGRGDGMDYSWPSLNASANLFTLGVTWRLRNCRSPQPQFA